MARRSSWKSSNNDPSSLTPELPEFLILGQISRPHGLGGTFKTNISFHDPERLTTLKKVWISSSNQWREFTVNKSELRQDAWYLQLDGIDTIEKAEELRNQKIALPFSILEPLDQNNYYHFQLLGLNVVTQNGRNLGEVVQVLNHSACDFMLVKGEKEIQSIPLSRDLIQSIVPSSGKILLKSSWPDED